ncbi:hypothetical protein UFOVP1605_49 [uncultured Caudovirales phage]|uniref:Uncharacterized protein n=1 Tax=uncultured Caudovirales phage TaxID=2100421 RepID=A0A6J5SUY0_9CAUD|nr:hypothetical protein UFOVP1605_49 [uncultured Caudovirales phage]
MINGNDLAFAKAAYVSGESIDPPQEGITVRAYFAAMMLQGLLAGGQREREYLEKAAVLFADDLIAELNKSDGIRNT